MRKYSIIQENGVILVKKFRSDNDALAFIADPKNLHTYGVMDVQYKDTDGNVCVWDKSVQKWVSR